MSDEVDVLALRLSPADLTVLVDSRFLFVDVSAQRAKQLRKGALPRLDRLDHPGAPHIVPHKLERVAMEEVRTGLIPYQIHGLVPHVEES